jgi:hypothetical protein
MKKLLLIIVIGAVAAAGLVFAYRQMNHEVAEEKESEEPVSAPSRLTNSAGGEVVLTLDAETQKRVQLHVAPLAAATMPSERVAFGRVIDPVSLGTALAEQASAQAAQTASSKEFERLKTLRDQGGNASARSLETAEAAAQRDQIALRWAQQKVELTWGQAIAKQPDLAAFVHSLASQESALIRVDLPAGDVLAASPTGARVTVLAEEKPVAAEVLGPASATNPELQGQGFLLLVKPRPARLTPGAAVTAYLSLPGEPLQGVLVPREAVLRVGGRGWVFVQTGEETFARRAISLDHVMSEGWFVSTGLAAGDRAVTTGAQTLLSEEFKSQIPGE